jgi:hypothetical protein
MRRACAWGALILLCSSHLHAQDALPATTAPTTPTPDLVAVRIAPEWGYRRFVDSEPSTSDKHYAASGIFLLGARADVYPFTGRTDALGNLGFTGSYTRAFGLTSIDIDTIPPTEVDSNFYHADIGLQYRLSSGGRLVPTLVAAYERWVFDFDDPAPMPRESPIARYSLLEAGANARLALGPVALLGDAELMLPVSIASLGDRDPTGGFGVRGKLGVVYELWPLLAIDLTGAYTLLTFGLPSVPGRSDTPGRVYDQYFVASLGLTLKP